jgi:3-dehydroquinate synthase
LLDEMPGILTARYPNKPLFVFTDDMVADLYGHRLLSGLRAAGATAELVAVEPGEASKCQSTADRVVAELRDRGFDRRSLLVNLGGGMVSDLGGYVAATYLRGVSYVNVPTTLLAQHDAAIGGKVAVNSQWAKNFVGAFHHPCGVYNDPDTLLTLPERELAAGVAESIKVAICGAPGLFDWLRHNPPSALRGNTELLAELVDRSARHKAALLDPDPYEVDLRRVLNLGHTFGHPLETHMAPTGMLHGEAVAFGMAVATGIGIGEGLLGHHEADQILELLALHGLPPGVHRDDLVAASKGFDDVRLVRAGALNFVVPTSTSTTEILPDLDRDALPRAIDWLAGNPISAGWILG